MKTINHTCEHCDSEFVLTFDPDKGEPSSCPFCAIDIEFEKQKLDYDSDDWN